MKVYVVLYEVCLIDTSATHVDKVFFNEKKADRYAEEQNKIYHNHYHWVEEIEVETDD